MKLICRFAVSYNVALLAVFVHGRGLFIASFADLQVVVGDSRAGSTRNSQSVVVEDYSIEPDELQVSPSPPFPI